MSDQAVTFRYTNWKGGTATRRVVPVKIEYGTTQWHPVACWLLHGFDLDKGAERAFVLNEIDFVSVSDV